jgi:hypothetical protein
MKLKNPFARAKVQIQITLPEITAQLPRTYAPEHLNLGRVAMIAALREELPKAEVLCSFGPTLHVRVFVDNALSAEKTDEYSKRVRDLWRAWLESL